MSPEQIIALAERIKRSAVISVAEQPKSPGPIWFMPLSDEEQEVIVKSLKRTARP